jgi:hypothetical protein
MGVMPFVSYANCVSHCRKGWTALKSIVNQTTGALSNQQFTVTISDISFDTAVLKNLALDTETVEHFPFPHRVSVNLTTPLQ